LGNFFSFVARVYQARAKSQFISTYLKSPIDQWGARRGVSAPFAEHIAIVLLCLSRQKKSSHEGSKRGRRWSLTDV